MTWSEPTHDSNRAKGFRLIYPGFSWCLRCGFPWSIVSSHSTWMSPYTACFPLCEDCWTVLQSPEARIEYYKTLLDIWEAAGTPLTKSEKQELKKAIANGG